MSRSLSASFALSISVVVFVGGCSSSSGGTAGPIGDTGTDDSGDTATIDTSSAPRDTAPADTAPAACWIVSPADPKLNQCNTCSEAKCTDQWNAAWGAAFVSSGGKTTGGACGDTGKCLCGCSEVDAICTEACDVGQPAACKTARRAIYDCEGTRCTTECGRGAL